VIENYDGGNKSSSTNAVVSGWEDGFVRCHDMTSLSRQIWAITNAHRGGTLSVSVHKSDKLEYIVTGGADSAVRVWKLSSRELFAQFSEHTKAVPKVLIDYSKPHIIHSTSLDGSVMSFDILKQRRIVGHFVEKGGHLTGLSQKPDGEQELVTCDTLGRILIWDCDIRDPVQSLQDPSRTALRYCAISPSGKFLAFAGDDFNVKVLNMVNSEILSVGIGHSSPVRAIAWTPDERQIISAGDDFSLCIWNFFLGGEK
jgi:WD40 repeat protein